jgi:hypothetical protein
MKIVGCVNMVIFYCLTFLYVFRNHQLDIFSVFVVIVDTDKIWLYQDGFLKFMYDWLTVLK